MNREREQFITSEFNALFRDTDIPADSANVLAFVLQIAQREYEQGRTDASILQHHV